MSALGRGWGGDGPAHEFKLRDPKTGDVIKVFTVRLIDDYVKMQLEKRLYERKLDTIRAQRQDLDPKEYNRRMEKAADDYDAGEFSPYTSKEGQKYLKTHNGALQLVSLVLQCSESEAISLGGTAANHAELLNLMNLVFKESFIGVDFDAKAKEKQAGGQEGNGRRAEESQSLPPKPESVGSQP